MSPLLAVGCTFRVSNPDMMVREETLRVVAYDPPHLRLHSFRYNLVDIAGVHYTSEDEVAGSVLREADARVVVAVPRHMPEVGLLLTAGEATWLLSDAEVEQEVQRGL